MTKLKIIFSNAEISYDHTLMSTIKFHINKLFLHRKYIYACRRNYKFIKHSIQTSNLRMAD